MEKKDKSFSRRDFLRHSSASLGVLGASGLAGCAGSPMDSQARKNVNKSILLKFAYDVHPPQGRTGYDPAQLFGNFSRQSLPSFIYLQTADIDGFVFPYGRGRWLSETQCRLDILEDQPMAIQATCKVSGFGQVMCRADNKGRLYEPKQWRHNDVFLFDLEAAESEIENCIRKIKCYGSQGCRVSSAIQNQLDQAQEVLKKAQRNASEPTKLTLASEALGIAMKAREAIELAYAYGRLQSSPKRPFSLSAFVDGNLEPFRIKRHNPEFAAQFKSVMNTGAVTMLWQHSQPEGPDTFDWRFNDEQFSWIEEHGLDGIGHCLAWLSGVPEWVKRIKDRDRLIQCAVKLTEETVNRYGHLVRLWTPCNEGHDWHRDVTGFSVEDRVELFKAITEKLRQIHPGAAAESDSCVITAPWRMMKPQWSCGPMEWYKLLDAAGVPDYVVGLQIYHGAGEYATFDMGRIADQIDVYSRLGRPIHLYAQTPSTNDDSVAWGALNGQWHGPWTEQRQAQWWENFMAIALSRPLVKGITTVTLADMDKEWMPGGGWIRKDLTPKPVMKTITAFLDKYVDQSRKVDWLKTPV